MRLGEELFGAIGYRVAQVGRRGERVWEGITLFHVGGIVVPLST